MEALKILGITERDVRRVSVDTANSITELESLSSYVELKDTPKNIIDAYKSLYTQVEKYLFSNEFKKEAKKAGVSISVVELKEDEVLITEIPKVKSKTLSERMAERKKKKSAETATEIIKEAPAKIDVEIEKEVLGEPVIDEVSEIFGVAVKGTKSGEIIGRDKFSMMLSYGNADYILGLLDNSEGFHYRLNLPLSMGEVVFSFSNSSVNGNYKSILEVWKAYTENNSATMNLISRSESQLENLSNVLGFISVVKERIPLRSSELKNEKYNSELYEVVNDIYSRDISGAIYFDISKRLKIDWNTKNLKGSDVAVVYGIQYGDYVYESAERMYSKGGFSIVAKKYTFFVPKGLRKDEVFGEIGTHLKETSIKTSKFEKNVEIGKRFQVSTGKLEDAVPCRVIGSEYPTNKIYVSDELGNSYSISSKAYNYFLKYYGFVSLKVSESTIVVLYNDNIVGIISSEKINSKEIQGMFDIEEFKKEIRNIDVDAYDFMVSQMVEVEEQTEIEEEDIEGEDDNEEALKEELTERIDFLKELLEDAIEEGDNQTLIDELNMELESLNDLLEDIS